MKDLVNIIIPAIELNEELLTCLKGINKIKYHKFFVTILLDKENKKKLPKFKFKLNKLIVGQINMSKKRNIAAKKFSSKYIAFIDSDASPNKFWLNLAVKYLKSKKADIVGGPGIIFPNQNHSQKICYLSSRSYYVTGYQNFRKYKAKAKYCDWLESCNIIMERLFYLRHGGMDNNKYTGEDKEFFDRVKKRKTDLKVFYSPDLFIYHRQRGPKGYLMQRFCFGMDIINLIKLNYGIKGLQPIFPILFFLTFFIILVSEIKFFSKISILLLFLMLINIFVFLDIKKYIKSYKTLFLTMINIYLANMAWALGGIMGLIGLKKFILYKIFSKSHLKT